jgi:hypothetical protein
MSTVVKLTVEGALVKLLFHKQTDRGMRLLEFETRCVRRGEIHELVSTDQQDAVAGDRIDRVGFLGFVEIQTGGVIEKGDQVWISDRQIGTILGFDDCHFPNHYNILIAVDELATANDLELTLEQRIRFGGTQI